MLLRTKLISAKAKSKKGFTLVEAICAVFVLAIVFVGVLNAVAFSRQMIFTNNARDKASDKAQLVADEIFSTAMGFDPNDAMAESDLRTAITNVVNNPNDPQNMDPDTAIGTVNFVTAFTEPSAMNDSMDQIECIITPVLESCADAADGTVSKQEVVESGWNIQVRVFYKEIGNDYNYRCIDVSAFAPTNYVG